MPIREIDTQMLDTESWKTNTRSGRGEVPHSSEKDDCVHERSPLMNLDWKHHAQSEEHRRRTLLAMVSWLSLRYYLMRFVDDEVVDVSSYAASELLCEGMPFHIDFIYNCMLATDCI